MMDFALFPAWYEVFRLVVPAPEEENRLFAFIGPFSLTVIYYVHDYVYDGSMSSICLSNENIGLALNPRHYMCYSDNDDSLRVVLQYNLLLQNGIG